MAEYIECSTPGMHYCRWWEALENIIEKCVLSLRKNFNVEIESFEGFTPNNSSIKFQKAIQRMLEVAKLEQIILMLDEIEFITHGLSGALGQHWDNDFIPFWQTIRSVHQETKGELTFIVAGVNPSCVEKSHFSTIQNPIFQLALPHYLEPFDKELVREMVRTIGKYSGLKFDEDVYYYLQSTYGGHPFLIRIACSEIWKATNKLDPVSLASVSIKSFQDKNFDIKNRMRAPIKDILLSLVWWYPEEYDLLRILATGDVDFVKEYIENDSKSVFQFARYGILKKDKLEDFAIMDIREFLNQYGDAYKNEISPFTRGGISPDLLPEMPDIKSLGRLFELRIEVESNLRRIIILFLNVKNGFDQQKLSSDIIISLKKKGDRKSPEQLFIGRTPQDVINQLYLPDLKDIIIEHWDSFKPIFDNSKSEDRFKMNMETINIARRMEAHSKPFNSKDYENFDNSYNWVASRLSKIM